MDHTSLTLSVEAAPLPSVKQTITLFVEAANRELERLHSIRNSDENWDDDDVDVDMTVMLAGVQLNRMRSMDLVDYSSFAEEWFMAASAINLAAKEFDRPDCRYSRTLNGLRDLLAKAPELVEFAQRNIA